MTNNSHEQYREVQAHTADRGRLLMMLFDGCLNFLNLTKEGFKENNAQKSSKYMSKSQDIISELMNTLSFKHNKELAQNLASLYEFMLYYLTQANLEKNPDKVDKVIELLGSVADGYRQIVDNSKISTTTNTQHVITDANV